VNVLCVGLSHRTANVQEREKFAVPDSELASAAVRLGGLDGVSEAVILSTCNRVEFYAASDEPELGMDAMTRFFRERAPAMETTLYQLNAPHSVRHLFRVVCGVDSMVLGETEILGQVKKAYTAAADGNATSKHLNRLFQRAFHVAKEVRTKTSITRGPVSVGSVAVDLAERIFGRLSACKVMILGAGETAEQTSRALYARGLRSIFVSNRSYERAVTLASQMNGSAIHFHEWDRLFQEIDILIGSTAAPHPVITRERLEPLMAARGNRPLFIIDLAVPRDVDPAVNKLDGVYVYDIDSLQAIAAQSLAVRKQELAVCEQMIDRHVDEFSAWLARAHLPPPEIKATPRLALP